MGISNPGSFPGHREKEEEKEFVGKLESSGFIPKLIKGLEI